MPQKIATACSAGWDDSRETLRGTVGRRASRSNACAVALRMESEGKGNLFEALKGFLMVGTTFLTNESPMLSWMMHGQTRMLMSLRSLSGQEWVNRRSLTIGSGKWIASLPPADSAPVDRGPADAATWS
jgi:hypothetical protein